MYLIRPPELCRPATQKERKFPEVCCQAHREAGSLLLIGNISPSGACSIDMQKCLCCLYGLVKFNLTANLVTRHSCHKRQNDERMACDSDGSTGAILTKAVEKHCCR
jgi:hypothetical protein